MLENIVIAFALNIYIYINDGVIMIVSTVTIAFNISISGADKHGNLPMWLLCSLPMYLQRNSPSDVYTLKIYNRRLYL